MEQYKSKREVIHDFQQQLMVLERSLSEINAEEAEKMHHIQNLQNRISQLGIEIAQADQKKERARKSIAREAAELHKRIGIDSREVLPEEKEFLIRKAKELGTLVLTELNRIIQNRAVSLNIDGHYQKVRINFLKLGWFRAYI
jgi:predicted  nucleic acid-binding Zn-ribbon protein